jgi:D-alanyl-D-alanine carboxypeptidase (penicillin-binding protein 5/6)
MRRDLREKRSAKIIVCAWVLTFLCANFTLLPAGAVRGAELETTATSAMLMDADSGKILFEKDAHKELAPASVTKVMTLLVAAQAIDDGRIKLTDQVTASEKAAGMGGSQIYMAAGETLTLEELLISIALGSANDACVAVAEHISGSLDGFVEEMNAEAQALGLVNTHFVNTNGLPVEGHYTSAYDLAVISRKASEKPLILQLTNMKEYDLRGGKFKLWNTNKLLWWYDGADGLKTGWTNEAKYCLASTVTRDGLRLICVVMGVPEVRGHFNESMKIFNYGFAQYTFKQFAPADEKMGVVQMHKGSQREVTAITAQPLGLIVEKGKDKDYWIESKIPAEITAPVAAGDKLGEVRIYQGDALQKRVDLVARETVARLGFFEQIQRTVSNVLGIAE